MSNKYGAAQEKSGHTAAIFFLARSSVVQTSKHSIKQVTVLSQQIAHDRQTTLAPVLAEPGGLTSAVDMSDCQVYVISNVDINCLYIHR